MPKRKADQSGDKWLKEGATALEASRIVAATNCNQEWVQTLPTAEGQPTDKAFDLSNEASLTVAPPTYVTPSKSELAAEDLLHAQDEVAAEARSPVVQKAASEEDAAEWFWSLLAQSGYERW